MRADERTAIGPGTARAMNEFELIRRYFDRGPGRRVELGIGDDCALLAPAPNGRDALGSANRLAVSTDMLVEGQHFFPDVDPEALGHKALAVNLSDLAAMGATPRAFLLALALPHADETWLAGFARGLFALADRHGCELAGGDTTRGPLNVCITVIGDCPGGAALRRDRAEPGDDLWVSGELGGAGFALQRRRAGAPLPEGHAALERLERPEPRVGLGVALRHWARAAIDLSDGLLGDLAHVCERSRVGAEIDWSDVPVHRALYPETDEVRRRLALAAGDDYELLFTAAPENRPGIEALSAQLALPLTRIGRIVAGDGIVVRDARGLALSVDGRAFDHFA